MSDIPKPDFDTSAMPLAIEDWSEIIKAIKHLKTIGVKNVRKYIVEHPNFISKSLLMLKILKVNQPLLDMYGAKTFKEFTNGLDQIFLTESIHLFKEQIIGVSEGMTYFEDEAKTQTLQDEPLTILIRKWFPKDMYNTNEVLCSLTPLYSK